MSERKCIICKQVHDVRLEPMCASERLADSRRRAIANLRHLYRQMLLSEVLDTKEAALGLLGPAIEVLEST